MNIQLKTMAVAFLQAGLVGAMPAFGQAVGPLQFQATLARGTANIGLPGPRIGYEDRIPEGKVLDAQYAILHALMGYQGHYGDSTAADQALLASMDLSITPLNGAERAILDAKLGQIRSERNNGIATAATKKHISLQAMAERHRELIRRHQASLSVQPKGSLSSKAAAAPVSAERQRAMTLALLEPINALKAAKTPEEVRAAVDRFNAAADAFGKHYRVGSEEGLNPGAALDREVAIYGLERAESERLGGKKPGAGAGVAGLPDAATLATKADLDARFDGQGRKVAAPWRTDNLAFNPIRPASASVETQNAPAARADSEPPAPKGGKAAKDERGLFGMLGSLFAGLFRTLSRVASAVFSGVVGVAKAVIS